MSDSVTPQLLGIVVPDPAELIRLRHAARELSLFPSRLAKSAVGGNYRSRFRGRGMDFEEVRPYQAGDDVRTIDWRVTARTNTVHTKVFTEERERPVLIVADLRNSMFFGSQRLKSLIVSEVAAYLAWAGLNANDRVGALIFTPTRQRDSRSRKSYRSVLQIIRHLSEACQELLSAEDDNFSLQDILEDARRVATPGSTVVIISDFRDIDRHCEKPFYELAKHCDLTVCQVQDPLDTDLPPPGIYSVTDKQHTVNLNTRNLGMRESFSAKYRSRQQQLIALCNRLGSPLLTFSTSQPVLATLSRFYGRKRRGKSA